MFFFLFHLSYIACRCKGVFTGKGAIPPLAIHSSPKNILLDVTLVIYNFIGLIGTLHGMIAKLKTFLFDADAH